MEGCLILQGDPSERRRAREGYQTDSKWPIINPSIILNLIWSYRDFNIAFESLQQDTIR